MQLSLYTLLTTELSLADSLALAAETGWDAVDLRQGRDEQDQVHLSRALTEAEAHQVRAQVEAAGLHVSGLTTYYRLGALDPALAQAELEGLRRGLQLAAVLGARFLRCSGPVAQWEQAYEPSRAALRRQVEELLPAASEAEVVLTIEQHGGTLVASAGQILDMLRGIASEHLGVVYDPGNCIHEGYERPAVQVDMLRRFIRAVHVKNMSPKPSEGPAEYIAYDATRLDQGQLDWPDLVGRLRTEGYEGYLTLEDFYGGFPDLREKLRWDAAYLRKLTTGPEAGAGR